MFILLFITALAHAASPSHWTLFEKVSGPDSWDCPASVTLFHEASRMELRKTEGVGSLLWIDGLNQGRNCVRRQNGSIFGTLRCFEKTFSAEQEKLLFQEFSCSSDSPFHSSCDPFEGGPAKEVLVTNGQWLRARQKTGSPDVPVFECMYRR